jgi:hypothetical protein
MLLILYLKACVIVNQKGDELWMQIPVKKKTKKRNTVLSKLHVMVPFSLAKTSSNFFSHFHPHTHPPTAEFCMCVSV